MNILIIKVFVGKEYCYMSKIRILAAVVDALHKEMLRITFDIPGYPHKINSSATIPHFK